MQMRFAILCALVGASLCSATEPAAEPKTHFQVHNLRFAEPAATEQAVRGVLGEGETLVLDKANNRLLVVATDEHQRLVAEIVAQLDVPPKNVRIEVQFDEQVQETESAFGVKGSGKIILNKKGAHPHVMLQPQLEQRRADMTSSVTQILLVASGREGMLGVGTRVPHLDWFMQYGGLHGYFKVEQQLVWQEVGARLVVQPTVLGDGPYIRIRLTPELSGFVEGKPHQVRFVEAATEVTVADGQPFELAGFGDNKDFYERFLIGVDRSGRNQSLRITLTPHVGVPGAP